jgi:hypothetical protein
MRMAAAPSSYKATDVTPAAAALPTEAALAAQSAAAAEDSLLLYVYLLGPLHLSGPSNRFLYYIFHGIYCVKKMFNPK